MAWEAVIMPRCRGALLVVAAEAEDPAEEPALLFGRLGVDGLWCFGNCAHGRRRWRCLRRGRRIDANLHMWRTLACKDRCQRAEHTVTSVQIARLGRLRSACEHFGVDHRFALDATVAVDHVHVLTAVGREQS